MSSTPSESIKPFSIYDYRAYSGYTVTPSVSSTVPQVLCVGSCDLSSIRPEGVTTFTWAELLSKHYACSTVTRACSLPTLVSMATDALARVHTPRYLCLTLPIPAKQVVANGLDFTVSKNSAKVARFAWVKGLISRQDYDLLLASVDECHALSQSDWQVTEHYRASLEELSNQCSAKGVQLLWCPNGTKTANDFFKYHILRLTDDLRGLGTYVGWVPNTDLQPDSSLGTLTHEELYATFKAFLP